MAKRTQLSEYAKANPVTDPYDIGFEVLSIRKADHKKNFVVVNVKYPNSDTIYEYCRAERKNANGTLFKSTILDGVEVFYNSVTYNFVSAERLYNTSGRRRSSTTSIAKKRNTAQSIKDEMDAQKLQVRISSPNYRISIPDETAPKEEVTPEVGAEQKSSEEVNHSQEVRHSQYDTIKTCLMAGIPLYLAGPAGSGKNYTVEQICRELGWEFYFSNSVQQEYKITGFIDAGGKFHETEFYKACTSGKDCVFFLDEMDASIPEVLILLNAAIASRYFEFPTGRVTLDHVHFVAAGNTVGSGADELYTGRMVLDQATLDRFAIIQFDYDKNIELALTNGNTELVEFVRDMRHQARCKGIRATFSYRCLEMVTALEKANMGPETVLRIAVMKGINQDTINTFNAKVGRPKSTRYHEALAHIRTAGI